jgi:septal ring-binding cell division protein DamX
MEHPGKYRYSIQLELACESSTLDKAFAADPDRRHLWIAPSSFRGRRCYRVLWGKFADLASARGAKGAVPALFARDGNRPTVVALGPAAAGGKRKR